MEWIVRIGDCFAGTEVRIGRGCQEGNAERLLGSTTHVSYLSFATFALATCLTGTVRSSFDGGNCYGIAHLVIAY